MIIFIRHFLTVSKVAMNTSRLNCSFVSTTKNHILSSKNMNIPANKVMYYVHKSIIKELCTLYCFIHWRTMLMRIINYYLCFIRCIFHVLLFTIARKDNKNCCIQDIKRILKWEKDWQFFKNHLVLGLCYALVYIREYRSVFYYRFRKYKKSIRLCNLFFPAPVTIEIGDVDIGGGFMISHCFAVIGPKKAGTNFRVGPGVVVGRNGDDFPVIGNNVYLASNSTVIGKVTIGDNVIVGAGSVVTKDLPGNGVYVGNPAKLIHTIDDNVRYLNEIM